MLKLSTYRYHENVFKGKHFFPKTNFKKSELPVAQNAPKEIAHRDSNVNFRSGKTENLFSPY
jgi:hypothetical protein